MLKILRLNESFILSGAWHGSVGETFDVEYDEDKFFAERSFAYKHAYDGGKIPPGGDEGKVTYALRPKKIGFFTVTAVEAFRGEVKHKMKYKIIVL